MGINTANGEEAEKTARLLSALFGPELRSICLPDEIVGFALHLVRK